MFVAGGEHSVHKKMAMLEHGQLGRFTFWLAGARGLNRASSSRQKLKLLTGDELSIVRSEKADDCRMIGRLRKPLHWN
jgi:hypothetical protein